MNEVLTSQEQTSIDVKRLTFEDWQQIASACENSEKWGFYKWLENSSELKTVGLDTWKNISNNLGYSKQWAAKMYMEHSD